MIGPLNSWVYALKDMQVLCLFLLTPWEGTQIRIKQKLQILLFKIQKSSNSKQRLQAKTSWKANLSSSRVRLLASIICLIMVQELSLLAFFIQESSQDCPPSAALPPSILLGMVLCPSESSNLPDKCFSTEPKGLLGLIPSRSAHQAYHSPWGEWQDLTHAMKENNTI